MLPFSLGEAMVWNDIDIQAPKEEQAARANVLTDDYMRNGGYPETIKARNITKNYLSTLFDSILLKDVAKRHNVRNTTDLYNLATYLLSNFCNPISSNDLATELGLSSVATTKKFCDYLAEPYLFFYLPRKIVNFTAQTTKIVRIFGKTANKIVWIFGKSLEKILR